MTKPRLLDLFCGAGGAAMGYHRAGFDVVGVDIRPQPNYPFTFWLGDALAPGLVDDLGGFDAIHASPPCQAYTHMSNRWRGKDSLADERPSLIAATRWLLEAIGMPFVIENVLGAKEHLVDPVTITGETVGLRVHRPRLFETNWPLMVSKAPRQKDPVAVYGKQDGRRLWTRADGSELHAALLPEAAAAMGIDWMTWDELREAIPPAYTELVGHQLMQHVQARAAA